MKFAIWNFISNVCSSMAGHTMMLKFFLYILQVKYFDRRRDYLKYKEKLEKEGFDPVEETKAKV